MTSDVGIKIWADKVASLLQSETLFIFVSRCFQFIYIVDCVDGYGISKCICKCRLAVTSRFSFEVPVLVVYSSGIVVLAKKLHLPKM